MKREQFSPREQSILFCLSSIPQKMLTIHGAENATEFVLHELSGACCFNFAKAAYFVDNPDFNCCKGVAGCCCDERYCSPDDPWCVPTTFSEHMQQSRFNKRVRQIQTGSMMHDVDAAVHSVAEKLEISNPLYYMWQIKNDNHGVLIVEGDEHNFEEIKAHLPQGVALLGFCPIF